MRSVEIDGVRLEYFEEGRGEPMVLVHGSASDHRTWHGQRAVLAERFRTIVYSRRYHWPNDPIPEGVDYSMDEHVDDLHALLLSLDAAPAHLVGSSYGAYVCLLLAMRQPDLVRTLSLAEPPVLPLLVSVPPRPAEIVKLALSKPRAAAAVLRFGARGMSPAMARARRGDMESAMRIFGKAVLGREFFRRLSPSRWEQMQDNAIEAELLGSGFVPLDADEVREIRPPSLLLTGEKSPRLFGHLVDRLQELLPHVQRVVIPGASHGMNEDNPTAFNDAVSSFVTARANGLTASG